MAASSASDRKYLEWHGSQWRVVVNVPRKLQIKLGTKLKRPLATDSLKEANVLKWDVIAEFKALIEQAYNPALSKDSALNMVREKAMREAVLFAQQRGAVVNPEEHLLVNDMVSVRVDEILGRQVGEDEEGEAVFEPQREAIALEFAALASGQKTPIDLHHKKYMAMSGVKARTMADDTRALGLLLGWCKKKGIPAYLQAITKREAVRFCDDLPQLGGKLSPVTLNKYISRLSVYWSWLENRHEVEHNVWQGRRLKEPQQTTEQKERPFSDDEMSRLLSGDATPQMHDLMRIAALTGARLDVIVCLKVKHCENNTFVFKPQKKEPGPRLCPVHPALYDIIERRTDGREGDDDLFPEWPGVQKAGSLRERSFKTSNHFTNYRRSVGVDDTREGKRRGLVNFHSFRRWFITKAEQAGQPESVIAVVVGHKRPGMTFGVYSAGPLLEQARACVEAVKLPEEKKEREKADAAE